MGFGHVIRALAARSALAACALALATCSPIMLDEESLEDRRIFVNDRADNDSLKAQVLRNDGVKFVLQPGKPYMFSVTTARTSDVLDVYTIQAGGQKAFKKITAIHDGERQLFPLTSPLATAGFFRARLLTGTSAASASAIEGVALESQGDGRADTLQVKLFFVQKLRNLPTESAKTRFAEAFFQQLNNVFRPFGIAVTGVIESVDAGLDTLVFPFTDAFIPIRGQRVANHASLYLVDSISVGNSDTGPQGTVLGFSPREVVDLSEHRESRVILANRATAAGLAVTAAHELGHFFGMRHTVSTRHDMLQDEDFSNVEDGFTDTRFCHIDQAVLSKTSAAMDAALNALPGAGEGGRGRSGSRGPFCLRIADNSCSEPDCDLENLMHPVGCGFPQLELSEQQISFLKRNMAMYRL